ncbi:MAG TPA: nuclear transport factor 2 family protein, partial [Acetobacteraceae bacterium]|nr:nuclear transport factor 2 family protein [Acetobacteraceae bacterium]
AGGRFGRACTARRGWCSLEDPDADEGAMGETESASANQLRLRSLYASYAAGNRTAFNDLLAEDVSWHSVGPPGLPWSGQRTGRDAVIDYFRTLEREADILGYTLEHGIEQGDWLILLATIRVRMGQEDSPRDYPKVDVVRFRDGKVAEFREYYDTAAALEQFRAARGGGSPPSA